MRDLSFLQKHHGGPLLIKKPQGGEIPFLTLWIMGGGGWAGETGGGGGGIGDGGDAGDGGEHQGKTNARGQSGRVHEC